MLPENLSSHPAVTALQAELPGAITGGKTDLDEPTLFINPAQITAVCALLKKKGFNRLVSITAVDWHPAPDRFEIVYHLASTADWSRLRLKYRVSGDQPEADSVCSVWRAADWYEREMFDLFGITFHNHPNLKRILMPEDWEGHPLRKDYPVHGHKYSYQNE
jgi:NADH-quinone oxidoreductase subunit C